MTDNKAFRDYATRVSFNLTLSRNQIAQLRSVMVDIEYADCDHDTRWRLRNEAREPGPDHYIMGTRALKSMGLIIDDPKWVAENERLDALEKEGKRALRKYWGTTWQLTDAGEHVVELLRIAGLIAPAAANVNRKARKKA